MYAPSAPHVKSKLVRQRTKISLYFSRQKSSKLATLDKSGGKVRPGSRALER